MFHPRRLLCGLLAAALLGTTTLAAEPQSQYELKIAWVGAYDSLSYAGPGLMHTIKVTREGKQQIVRTDYGLVNFEGEVLLPCEYEYVGAFSSGAAPVIRDGLCRYIDHSGAPAFPGSYAVPVGTGEFQEERAAVQRDGKWGFLAPDGSAAVPFQYDEAEPFSQGRAAVALYDPAAGEKRWGYVDKAGVLVTPCRYRYAYGYHGGLACVADERGKYGYLDLGGQPVTPMVYDSARDLVSGQGIVGLNGKFGMIDAGGALFIPCEYERLDYFRDDGLAWAMRDGKWGRIDRENNVAVPFTQDSRSDAPPPPAPEVTWSEGLAPVLMDGKWGYVDQGWKLVVPAVYDEAGPFSHGVAVVRQSGQTGILKNPLYAGKTSDWALTGVLQAQTLGLVTERTGTYQTYDITRLQFAELVVNLLEKELGRELASAEPKRFVDTRDPVALKAAAAGVVTGTGDGTAFSPKAYITREQMAVMLYRAQVFLLRERDGLGFTPLPPNLTGFTDAAAVSTWAVQAVGHLNARGILQGTAEGVLSPRENTTVEQAILLVMRTFETGG